MNIITKLLITQKIVNVLYVDKIKTILFYLLIFSLPFQTSKYFFTSEAIINGKLIDYFLPRLYLHDFLIVGFIFFSLFSFLISKKRVKITLYQKLVFIISLISLIILPFLNRNFLNTIPFLIKYLRIAEFSIFIIALGLQKKTFYHFNQIFRLFILSPLIVSIILLGEFIFQHSLGFKWLGEWKFASEDAGLATIFIRGYQLIRPRGTFPHPNIAAFYLSLSTPLSLYYFMQSKKKRHLVVLILNILGVIICFSRVGYVLLGTSFLIVSLFCSLITRDDLGGRQINQISTSGGVILGTIFLFFLTLFSLRTSSLLGPDYSSLERRFILADIGQKFIIQNFFTGVGLNRFLFNLDSLDYLALNSFLQPVHNFHLLFLAENGVFIFLIFIAVFLFALFLQLIIFISSKPAKSFPTLYLIMALLLFFLASFWDHYFYSLFQGNLLLVLFLGLSLFYRGHP